MLNNREEIIQIIKFIEEEFEKYEIKYISQESFEILYFYVKNLENNNN